MRTIECATRDAWLEERRNGIGASDAPVVLRLSKWSNPVELWQEKLGLLPPREPTQQMEWGTRLEPLIRQTFAEKSGVNVHYWGAHTICVHDKHPWMRASLDGVADLDGGQGIVEIKAVSAAQKDNWERELPVYYQAQMQHQMAVTGLQRGLLVVLFGGQELCWYPVQRHPEFQALLEEREGEFWRAVEEREQPEAKSDDELASAAKGLLRVVEGKSIKAPELLEQHREILAMKKQRKELDEKIRRFSNQVIIAAGDAEVVELDDDTRYSVKLIEKKPYMCKAQKYRVANLLGGHRDDE